MNTLDLKSAFSARWNGKITGFIPTSGSATASTLAYEALNRFTAALEHNVLSPATGGSLSHENTAEGVVWQMTVSSLAGENWKLLGNLLAFSGTAETWRKPMRIASNTAEFLMTMEPRLYKATLDRPEFEVDLDKATGYLGDF